MDVEHFKRDHRDSIIEFLFYSILIEFPSSHVAYASILDGAILENKTLLS